MKRSNYFAVGSCEPLAATKITAKQNTLRIHMFSRRESGYYDTGGALVVIRLWGDHIYEAQARQNRHEQNSTKQPHPA